MSSELEIPICKYYDGGKCLRVTEFPQEPIPTQAVGKSQYHGVGGTVFFCEGSYVTRSRMSAFQKDKCNGYEAKTIPSPISSK